MCGAARRRWRGEDGRYGAGLQIRGGVGGSSPARGPPRRRPRRRRGGSLARPRQRPRRAVPCPSLSGAAGGPVRAEVTATTARGRGGGGGRGRASVAFSVTAEEGDGRGGSLCGRERTILGYAEHSAWIGVRFDTGRHPIQRCGSNLRYPALDKRLTPAARHTNQVRKDTIPQPSGKLETWAETDKRGGGRPWVLLELFRY
ncbi:hypothetical protein ACP4OV_019225 [Aristida adscensionis]